MGRRVALCIAMFACGCGGAGSAASLRAPIDTLVINSRKSVRLPDELLPFRLAALASYETSPASIAHVTHAGAVACDTTGDAVVVVSTRLTRRSALLK